MLGDHIEKDTAIQTVANVRAKVRRPQSKCGLALLVIDYLQLTSDGRQRTHNRVQEMDEISRSLKGIARDFEISVLARSSGRDRSATAPRAEIVEPERIGFH